MASPKAKLTIPFGLGLKTEIDPKLLPVGNVPRLENAVWTRKGELLKRPGSTSLGTQYAANTPGSMPAPWQLATHKGALVSISKAGPRPIGVYSPGVNKWVAPAGSTALDNINGVSSKLRGQILPQRTPIYRANSAGEGARRVSRPTSANNGTYEAVCWIEDNASTSTVWVQFIELATGKKLFAYSQQMASTTTNVRVVFVNGEFDLIYITGTSIKARFWTAANIAAGSSGWQVSSEFTLSTEGALTAAMDVIVTGTDASVLYCNATNPRIVFAAGGVSNNSFVVSTLTNSTGGALSSGTVAWMRDLSGSGKRSAIISSGSQGTTVQWGIGGGTPTASYTMDAASGANTFQTGFTITNNATGEFVVLWEPSPAVGIRWGRRSGGVVSSPATWILSAGLASMPFLHGSDFYSLIRYDSTTQGTFFAIRVPTNLSDATDMTRTPSARFCTDAAVTLSSSGGTMPDVSTISTDVYRVSANVKTRLVESPTGDQFDTGIDDIALTFNPITVNSPREFADNLYVCGGILAAFDGQTFAEEGFHLAPEITGVTQQVGGNLAALGNYEAVVVYRYTDAFGRIRRSQPSIPVAFSMTGSNQTALVSAKTLKLHGRPCRTNDGGRPGSVVIELYRTTNNETDTYSLAAVMDNDESVDTITFTDTASDASLGEDLYTTGGVLEFQPPPAPMAVVPYKDRLALISSEDPTLIWVSLPLNETEGPRFNDISAIRIDDSHGDLTGLAVVDDRLVAFKRDAIYAIVGDGPDVNGNGTFGIAQLIASGMGCVEPRSIVQTPDSVMFRPPAFSKGIMILNRGLAVDTDTGDDVQGYLIEGVSVADAIHLPDVLRTKFFLNTGTTLVYDHTIKTWDTDTNQSATAATVWRQPTEETGRAAYQIPTTNMFVVVEDASNAVFDDTSSPVEMYVETPWLSLADLKGFFRFDRIQLVGETRTGDVSAGYIVTVSLFKDFVDTAFYSASKTMLVTDDINAVEVRYSSKLSTLKVGVRISMNPVDGSNFAGPKLTAMSIWYLTKYGLKKIPSGNRLT